ncbi:MAG: alpha-1 4-glucan:alpha-1 4-glucan 6-glycosyltransferase [Nitrospirae bacterium]|nr:MAG: alpha-1 4-glucan:alpha-1 4-glucan 6-glycosyltransferase [Nitrospirota bacterium]
MELNKHINAFTKAKHGNPFEILGPHILDGKLFIRAFIPEAGEAWIATRDAASAKRVKTPMLKLHKDGFFEAVFPERAEPVSYTIKVITHGGVKREFHDPYAMPPVLTDFDLHLLTEGTHYKNYEKMGSHVRTVNSIRGVHFAVWAPNAKSVSVIGEFNDWDARCHPMRMPGTSGIWELFIPGLQEGSLYKFEVYSRFNRSRQQKSDPFAFFCEKRPKSANIVYSLNNKHDWQDAEWMDRRKKTNWFEQPMSIYEVHLGSWMRIPEEENRFLTYHELADRLIPHVKGLGCTHIELLPVSEHPLDASWGYQTIGYYAATSRFGRPEEFMYFVDQCHLNGLGVLIDWVPAHFPKDAHGLRLFDGTALYEHADPRKGEQRDWGTLIFNYGRNEVRNYLIGNALYWLDKFHIDGLRVDAVASMLYLDYSKKPGEWVPNCYGGNENLEAIDFLKRFNEVVHKYHPGVLTIAEESTSWPAVSRPTYLNGLGFSMKWNMGWMHDTLDYFSNDPIFRKYQTNKLTFGMLYAFTENFVLPFSHDEVVHGKRSLLDKMPGDLWQKFANQRLLLAYMFCHPGKKLLFSGFEFGQRREWNFDQSLDWHLTIHEPHAKLTRFVQDLHRTYRSEPSLHEVDFDWRGFEWVDFSDYNASIFACIRRAKNQDDFVLCVFNCTPVPRRNYRIGVPCGGFYREILNSDSEMFWGSNVGNHGGRFAEHIASHKYPWSLSLTLPPLGALVLKPQ